MELRKEADNIIRCAINEVLPDRGVKAALLAKAEGLPDGRTWLFAIGKAAWQMADAAAEIIGDKLAGGIVITKYGHVKGDIANLRCFEAGHPVPDENSFLATREAVKLVDGLSIDDVVIFLVSGGGSSLFEYPLIPGQELADITEQLLRCGADIREINTIRKRLSAVKGGQFAELCAPAKVYAVVLSDIVGDPLDMIASGPAYPDHSTAVEAVTIARKYDLQLSEKARGLLDRQLPQRLDHVETVVTGSVNVLCRAAAEACRSQGYVAEILSTELNCEARDAGCWLGEMARAYCEQGKHGVALIAGGETIVHVHGQGKGGRNQEIALAAAEHIRGLDNVAIFSFGSDGTDGPTDAAGGYVDGNTMSTLLEKGLIIKEILAENDAYHGLEAADGLIITGPTGTNVNDVSIVLIR